MTGDDAIVAVLAGLTGAPHCIVMCGGIGASIAMEARRSAAVSLAFYHVGRILTYAITGALMGAAGSFLNLAGRFVGLQGAASILGGVFILLWAWRKFTLPLHAIRFPGHERLKRLSGSSGSSWEYVSIFLTGLLLGLLPCGLTYAMQMNAAATGNVADGFLIMLVFGLTTFPMLFAFALSAKGISKKWRKQLRGAGQNLAILMGILSIMKGLSANGWIPSIHPWLW
ncbi:sulfite exporter TauE/SafE family protein [Cohnella thailandensis]|uniref:Sulfite exporter TauE/SafE family protein n=1 Tax=Cohnella thailandensis TaxID=557557 RepID=A0A841T6C7_9BACL|nr:sulfite exporter TauE/SafE family protein [Cohnella thailandensis]MBB6638406.1 sulfite exporter TauE/SafE family protein [Cohnella thailandensis]MBP1977116.1 sulfite exporter TauE/SafE [Cohnella thailandensis]